MGRNAGSGTSIQARRHRPSHYMMVLLLAFAAACLLVFATARGASGQVDEGEVDEAPSGALYAAGELIVTYEDDISEAPVESLTEEVEGEVEEDFSFIDAQLLDFPEVKDEGSQEEREQTLEEKKQELEQDPAVESVEYNYLRKPAATTTDDPGFRRQWHLRKVSAPLAWDESTGGNKTRIAVIDSGLDLDHPDFEDKVVGSINASEDGGSAEDQNGHGTHVAGIASAVTDNGVGVAGTCPDCGLLIADTQDRDGVIFVSAIVKAIDWAIDKDADVINMSLAGDFSIPSDSERNAVNRAWDERIVVVAAAGNQDESLRKYPAAYKNVIAVSSTTRQDTKADSSNFGSWVDVSAPGGSSGRSTSIYSTLPGGYGYKSGTSMASPIVAGTAGLLSSQGLSNIEVRKKIESTATDLGVRGKDRRFGHGRVDAAAAVGARERNTPPTVSNLRPKPDSKLRGKRVGIRATVRDGQTNLRKRNITLSVDGRRVGFDYNVSKDRLTRKLNLPRGNHKVRIVVRDGEGLRDSRTWRFRTVKASGRRTSQSERDTNIRRRSDGTSPSEAPGQSISQSVTVTQSR